MNEKTKRRGLGRGLSALMGDEGEDYAALDRVRSTKDVPVDKLRPNKFQPRRYFNEKKATELADSIREKGVLEPLLVRRVESDPTCYEIVAGERRWRAAQKAQLHQVPVIIKDLDDAEALEISLIENIQREDLTPLDQAEGYQRLKADFNYTQDQTGRLVGKSRSHVANMLRLLSLPNSVKAYLADGRLSAGHARALVTADDPAKLAIRIVNQSLNVREAEKITKKPRRDVPSPAKDPDTLALARDISDALGLKVDLKFLGEKKGGEVKITYATLEQLDEICKRLCSQGE
ncbi:MAG TPA: ParB/RepB/Spo0J family partition protein [Sneathiellales bacterium]|nr:ParB/RepB/Spo0J family partition protein [Sneathiellales bacterium]